MWQTVQAPGADAILVSQVVTQRDTHTHNLTNFVELLEAEHLRDRFILVVGGPRISHRLALEIGLDAGFGPGTYAEHVASFLGHKLTGAFHGEAGNDFSK